jgi:hypothetical protein
MSVRWGLVGFKALFMVLFGGVGAGFLVAVVRARKEGCEPARVPGLALAIKRGLTDGDGSLAFEGRDMGARALVLVWNLISLPLPFLLCGEVAEKKNYLALIDLLFLLDGIGLFVWGDPAQPRVAGFRRDATDTRSLPGGRSAAISAALSIPGCRSTPRCASASFFPAFTVMRRQRPGDEILVFPPVGAKDPEVVRGISQILFQIAVVARVALRLDFDCRACCRTMPATA